MPACDLCGRDGTYKCSRCGEAFYCSADHQREAWRLGHKTSCKKITIPKEARKVEADASSKNQIAGHVVEQKPSSLKSSDTISKSSSSGSTLIKGVTGTSSRLKDGICVYVNLDRRSDRRRKLESLFVPHNWLGVAMKRIPAVDGQALSWSSLVNDRLITEEAVLEAKRAENLKVPTMVADVEECNTHLTLGGCGCALSHRAAWQTLVESGARWGLVLEDDVVSICDNFDDELEQVLSHLPVGWLLCYLGFHVASSQACGPLLLPRGKRFVGPLVPLQEGWLAGLYAYLLSKQGAQVLLERAVPFAAQVDAVVGGIVIPSNRCYTVQLGEFLAYSQPTEVSRDTDVQTFQEDLL